MLQPSRLLGFYQGFPIFDGSTGFAKLQSRLGIHLDPEAVMISTPLDKYEGDVYELAEHLASETGLEYSKKKNRVIFQKNERLIKVLGI
jgi:ArsR family metal-binding transcriptional regulator